VITDGKNYLPSHPVDTDNVNQVGLLYRHSQIISRVRLSPACCASNCRISTPCTL
jgi:hypothetical protein